MTHSNAWPERLLAQGQVQRRSGNAPLRLDDPARVWLVRAGQVEVFLVDLLDDGATGVRHHLASIAAGGLLLGIAAEGPADFTLLAVPHADTEVLEWSFASLATHSGAADVIPALAPALEVWLRALSGGMAYWARPRPAVGNGVGADEAITIPAGQRCSGQHALAWIRLAPAAGLFLDIQELPFAAGELTFPLAPEAWLLTTAQLALQSRPTAAALRDGDAWAGVASLHRLLFAAADLNLRLANVDEYNRLQARRVTTEAERNQAFKDLMSVTAASARAAIAPVRGDSPLVGALRLIGREEGFEVRLPATAKPGDHPGLEEIARASGLRVRAVTLRDDWWRQDFGALLAFDQETTQPRVILSGRQGRPLLIDTTTGEGLAFDQARSHLAPTAFELTAHLPFRAMSFRDLLGFALARGWRDAIPMLLNGAILGLLGLATPIGTAYLIDTVIPDHEVGLLIEIGLVLAVLGGTAFVMNYVGTLAFSRAETRTGRALQSGMMDRMLRLPMSFFQGYSAGDLATRVMAITQIQTLASTSSVNAILSGLFGVFSFALMFYYDTRLALWAALLIGVYCLLSLLLGYLRLRQERPLAAVTGTLNNRLLQLILGVSKIRLAAGEDRAFSRWASLFAQSRHHQLAAKRIGAWQAALNQTLTLAGLLLFVLLIGKPAENGNLIAIGAFAALLAAFQNFAGSLTRMLQVATDLIAIRPQVERALPLLVAAPEIGEDKADPGDLSGAIEVSHLSFRYAPEGPLILDDVSLDVAPGEFVALVGASGSGKSTLLRLLLGFVAPENGGVFFDGKALASLDPTAVRRQMGVVIQNAQPMPGSLFDNIVGAAGGTLDDAWEAAERVGLAEDIRQMPMGLQTVILEGGGALSGGQIQRLMIARAVVGRPKILLLDEATSALDNRSQAVVTDSLDRQRVTRVVVAHRLSTVVHADRIYVLAGGRIVEAGNYEALMANNGAFARLAERQLT
jgi:ATP-binding cassette subfamily C protein